MIDLAQLNAVAAQAGGEGGVVVTRAYLQQVAKELAAARGAQPVRARSHIRKTVS